MKHLYLRPRCGICNNLFLAEKETFLALFRDAGPASHEPSHAPAAPVALFPEYGLQPRYLYGRLLCRRPPGTCRSCTTSEEAIAVHTDCYLVFRQTCPPIGAQRGVLWNLAAWRNPWPGSPNFHLLDRAAYGSHEFVAAVEAAGVCGITTLPLEIVSMIDRYLEGSLFRRYVAVRQIAAGMRLCMGESQDDRTVALSLGRILQWKRGGQVVEQGAQSSPHQPSVLRLTIDSRGLEEVQRLPQQPASTQPSRRHSNRVFVFLQRGEAEGITVHCRYGNIRLGFSDREREFQTWDTPAPPPLDGCSLYSPSPDVIPFAQFRAIDLSHATGLTFFLSLGSVVAIHAHVRTAPCAEATFQCLSVRERRDVTWAYLPLPPQDSVLALSLRFRMRLAGDVHLGQQQDGPTRDVLLGDNPRMFIYNVAEQRDSSIYAAYPKPPGEASMASMARLTRSPQSRPEEGGPVPDGYYSTAPLEHVAWLHVFQVGRSGFCEGILLQYRDGAQRAVGHCRIGVVTPKAYRAPATLCVARETFLNLDTFEDRRLAAVECSADAAHEHEDGHPRRICYDMRGNLEFWFDAQECVLRVS